MSNQPPLPARKRSVGRPKTGLPTVIKKSVSVKPATAEHLLSVGQGNLSKGIEAVTEFHKSSLINPSKKS